jgi:hypothetical protein
MAELMNASLTLNLWVSWQWGHAILIFECQALVSERTSVAMWRLSSSYGGALRSPFDGA